MHFVDHDKLIAPQVGNACNNLSEKTAMEKPRIKTAGLQARFRIYFKLDQLRVYVMRQLCDICSINEMSDCINVYGYSLKGHKTDLGT